MVLGSMSVWQLCKLEIDTECEDGEPLPGH